jgi:hypothetical protein
LLCFPAVPRWPAIQIRWNIHSFPKPAIFAGRLILILLILAAYFATAPQFTADLIRTKPAGTLNAKGYVTCDELRFEIAGAANSTAVITDMTQGSRMMLLPASKFYVVNEPCRTPSTPFFTPAIPTMRATPGRRQPAGREPARRSVMTPSLAARLLSTKGITQSGDMGYACVGRSLHFVIKWEEEKTAAEFRNIQKGPKPTLCSCHRP